MGIARCRRVLAGLADSLRIDFGKYASRHQIKYVDLLLREAPSMLGRRFVYAHLPGAFRARELAPALDLLEKNGALSPYGIRFSPQPFSVVDDLQSWPLYAVAGLFADRGWPYAEEATPE